MDKAKASRAFDAINIIQQFIDNPSSLSEYCVPPLDLNQYNSFLVGKFFLYK